MGAGTRAGTSPSSGGTTLDLHKHRGLRALPSPHLSGGLAQHCCSRFSAADPGPEHTQHPLHGEEHSTVSRGCLMDKELENEQMNARESK